MQVIVVGVILTLTGLLMTCASAIGMYKEVSND